MEQLNIDVARLICHHHRNLYSMWLETIIEQAAFIMKHGELGIALLSDYSVENAKQLLAENYHGTYASKVEFAYSLADDCYRSMIPESLISYFDYDALTHDLFIDDYFSVDINQDIHVFSVL